MAVNGLLHLHLLFAGEVSLGLLLEGAIAARAAEVVGLTLMFPRAAVGVLGVYVHVADRVLCGLAAPLAEQWYALTRSMTHEWRWP